MLSLKPAPAALFPLPFLLASSCGAISFDVVQDIPEQVVMGSPLPGGLLPASPLFQIPMMIDIDSQTKAQGTGPAHSANLKAITFTVSRPAGARFDFLSGISVSISATGLPDVEIARLKPVPAGTTISLDIVPGVDLLPYINAGAKISATAEGNLPPQDTYYTGRVVVTVRV